jgi:hypothetical protein
LGNWGVLIREIALTIISRQEPGETHPHPWPPTSQAPNFWSPGTRTEESESAERGMVPLLVWGLELDIGAG